MSNQWIPGEDEYDAYEKAAESKLRYIVIEASSPIALADYVSEAIDCGLHPAGGPLYVNEMWHQALFAQAQEFMTNYLTRVYTKRA